MCCFDLLSAQEWTTLLGTESVLERVVVKFVVVFWLCLVLNSLSVYAEDHLPVCCFVGKDEGKEYINQRGERVLPGRYVKARNFSHGRAVVVTKHHSPAMVIDTQGNIVFTLPFTMLMPHGYVNGWLRVEEADEQCALCSAAAASQTLKREDADRQYTTFYDVNGQVVLKSGLKGVGNFYDGVASARHENKLYGYINKKGEWCIPPKYTKAGDFSEERALVVLETKKRGVGALMRRFSWQILNVFYTPEFEIEDSKTNKQLLLIDTTGAVIRAFPPNKYRTYGGRFREGKAVITKDSGDVFIDREGKEVFAENFALAADFTEGRALVNKGGKDGKWGYIDTTGRLVIPYQFDWAYEFSEGVATVGVDGRSFFIDHSGTRITEAKEYPYRRVGPFKNGLASARLIVNGETVYLNKAGHVVYPPRFRVKEASSDQGMNL